MWFSKKKKAAARVDYFALGRDGSLDDFKTAFAALKAQKDPRNNIAQLFAGAGRAFDRGRPESLQELLARPDQFFYEYCPYSYDDVLTRKCAVNVIARLHDLTKSTETPAARVNLALGKFSAAEKQRLLNEALYKAVDKEFPNPGAFVGTLLTCGADPNAAISETRAAGCITARAVARDLPADVLRKLHAGGADFDLAKRFMIKNQWGESLRDRLDAYRAKITGANKKETPAQNDALVIELAETVVALTARVQALEEALREKVLPPPAAPETSAAVPPEKEAPEKAKPAKTKPPRGPRLPPIF